MHALRPTPRPILTSLHAISRPHHVPITARSFQRSAIRHHDAFKHALERNQRWAAETANSAPDFFPTSAKGQAPEILWLGCSDSRVPETTILGLKPGDVFTHRNIANIVNSTDTSLLSVVEFSVKHVGVKHIVVCGHTKCGGVNATLANGNLGVLDIWMQPMRNLREKHSDELAKLDAAEKGTYLSKLNVKAGVENLRRIPTVIEAMRDRDLQLHGVIYDLATGRLEDLECGEDAEVGKKRLAAFERK